MRRKAIFLWVALFICFFPTCVKAMELSDGDYAVEVTLEGGSGRATVTTPCELTVVDGQAFAKLEWSSANYDYMIIDDVKYEPINSEGNSVFEIPVLAFDEKIPVIADTTAMSVPHEISYELTFYSEQIMDAKDTPMARARYSVYMALGIIGLCLVVSVIKKRRRKSGLHRPGNK